MRKFIATILLTFVTLFLPAAAYAYTAVPDCTVAEAAACQGSAAGTSNPISGPNGELIKVVHLVALVAGVAAVIVIIIGGFKYVTSDGNPQNIQSARNTILYAVVGLVVIVFGQTIIAYILGKL